MFHARPDYALLQDPRGKIPRDEPVYLLRGQDQKAQACLKLWCDLAVKDGSDPALIEATRQQILRMDNWQLKFAKKKSDMPKVAEPGTTPEVKKGQEWEATDFRNAGQRLVVEHVQGIDAVCKIIANAGGKSVMNQVRQIRIRLARFKEGSEMGWKLVKDVEAS
jgi:hypothetical protein